MLSKEKETQSSCAPSLLAAAPSLDFAYEWLGDVCNTTMFWRIVVHPEK